MRNGPNQVLLAGLLLLCALSPAWSQNTAEGTAVVGRYGEFPSGGLYVASNTFPLNSMIDVTNLSNGRSARLIVAQTLNDPGVFMVLSEAAATQLGVDARTSGRVRANPVQLPGLTAIDPNQDLPFHPDPDVNPAAVLGDPNESIIRPGREEPAATVTQPVPTAPAVPEAPAVASEPEPEPDPEPEPQEPALVMQPSLALDVTPEPASEAEPEAPVEPEPETEPATEPEPTPAVAGEPVDERDAPETEDVIGVTPSIAATIEAEAEAAGPVDSDIPDTPEVSLPRTNPQVEAPLALSLALATVREPVADAASADETDEPTAIAEDLAATDSAADLVDPLEAQLAAIAAEQAAQNVSEAPLEVAPFDDRIAATPDESADTDVPLPVADLSVLLEAEVGPAAPLAPNPVRVVAELPLPEEDSAAIVGMEVPGAPGEGQVAVTLPIAPVDLVNPDETPRLAAPLAEDEIALPIVPVEFVDADGSLRIAAPPTAEVVAALPEPDTADPADDMAAEDDEAEAVAETDAAEAMEEDVPADDRLRPSLIPEDAIVRLEPAEFRTPEPPEPVAEDVGPADAADEDVSSELAVADPAAVETDEMAEMPAADEAVAAAPVPLDEPAASTEPVSEPLPEFVTRAPAGETAQVEPRDDREWARANLPLVADLEQGASYVQVAAFTNPRSARQTLERLGPTFPVAVLSQDETSEAVYRIFVGPLTADEQGTALYTVRNRGFRDAFVRQP